MPPRKPQLNGVAERLNRTMVDMVYSMMSRASLPISFQGYSLETAAHILKLVPTKKVAKTPHKMLTWKVPFVGSHKGLGCEAFVIRETRYKLKPSSEHVFSSATRISPLGISSIGRVTMLSSLR